jgi:choline transport protein
MKKTVELQTLDEEILHDRQRTPVAESTAASGFDRDQYELARAGKKQVLKVSSHPVERR